MRQVRAVGMVALIVGLAGCAGAGGDAADAGHEAVADGVADVAAAPDPSPEAGPEVAAEGIAEVAAEVAAEVPSEGVAEGVAESSPEPAPEPAPEPEPDASVETTPDVFEDVATDAAPFDLPQADAVPLTHPVNSGDALVRILNLAQLAATSAGSMAYRMYDQNDPVCPGGKSATPSTSFANFDGQCHASGGEGEFDLSGAFAFQTPNTCNAGHSTPTTLTSIVLTDFGLTGLGSDGTHVNVHFDLAYSRDSLANGSVETWSGELKFDDYLHAWTPCCNAQLSVFSMLKGTHVTGIDVKFEHDTTLGNRFSGLLDIEGEGAVALSTPESLTYDSPCWRPKAGVIRFEGLHAAEIHFGYIPGPGTGTDSCSTATDTTTWTLDGVDQGLVTPDFWGTLTICIIAVG